MRKSQWSHDCLFSHLEILWKFPLTVEVSIDSGSFHWQWKFPLTLEISMTVEISMRESQWSHDCLFSHSEISTDSHITTDSIRNRYYHWPWRFPLWNQWSYDNDSFFTKKIWIEGIDTLKTIFFFQWKFPLLIGAWYYCMSQVSSLIIVIVAGSTGLLTLRGSPMNITDSGRIRETWPLLLDGRASHVNGVRWTLTWNTYDHV